MNSLDKLFVTVILIKQIVVGWWRIGRGEDGRGVGEDGRGGGDGRELNKSLPYMRFFIMKAQRKTPPLPLLLL